MLRFLFICNSVTCNDVTCNSLTGNIALLLCLWSVLCVATESEKSSVQHAADIKVQVNLLPQIETQFGVFENSWSGRPHIAKITFSSDAPIWNDELIDLAHITVPGLVGVADIKRLCWYLQQKRMFESVALRLEPLPVGGYQLFVDLQNAYTLRKVKCKGPLVGKDTYAQKYLIPLGDIFDVTQHSASLLAMQKALQADGFLAATLDDHITYDHERKQVQVTVHIDNVDPTRISTISITLEEGEERIIKSGVEEPIAMCAKELKGQQATRALMNEYTKKIEKILADWGFSDIAVVASLQKQTSENQIGVDFKISVSEQKRFTFVGNAFFTTKELLNKVLLLDNSLIFIPPALLVEDIEQLYKDKGFSEVVVTCNETEESITFHITEGPRIPLHGIEVLLRDGQNVAEQLSDVLDGYDAITHYDKDTINQIYEQLLNWYIKQGYWSAVITNVLVPIGAEHTGDPKAQLLRFIVEPGMQRRIVAIAIPGYESWLQRPIFQDLVAEGHDHHIVKDISGSEMSIPFDPAILDQQRTWLLAEFAKKNKLAVQVNPRMNEELSNESDATLINIELVWECTFPHESPTGEIRFGKTIITGMQTTNPQAVLRQLPWKEGDLWSKEKIEAGLASLRSLDMYDSVSIVPCEGMDMPFEIDSAEGGKPLQLNCVEKDPVEIMLRLGLMQVSKSFTHLTGLTYRVGGTVLWRNPLRQADILKLEGDVTRYTRTGALTYRSSGFSRYPIQTSSRLFTFKVDQPVIYGLKRNLYTESHHGISCNVKKQFGPWQATGDCGAELVKISGVAHTLAEAICYQPQFIDIYQPFIWLEPGVRYSILDNPVDPRKGIYAFCMARALIPFNKKNSPRVKLFVEQSIYYPLIGSLVGAAHMQIGHIFGAPFSVLLPAERFYLGGPVSIRGYGPRLAPPLNQYKDVDPEGKNICAWVPVGGKSIVLGNLELRYPVYQSIGLVVFNDIGLLSQNSWTTITADSIIGSTGFGLRYTTPLGLLRFDVGWKWRKSFPEEQRYSWFLTFGHAF